ncbi:MAG: TlpA family protein disulfide reductase [Nitrosomonadales bacterium]|nr:TlpA family protein disulfide reductase [Nitrosomonadales bacterium]
MTRSTQAFIFVAVALVGLAAGLYFRSTAQEEGPAVTPPALLDTALESLEGGRKPLGAWKGKVLVVNFWATWCGPCRKEIPEFIRMQQNLGGQGLQFVGIAIDDKDKVQAYVREFGINYPILVGELDAVEMSRSLGNELGGLPFTIVIDRSGKVVHSILGATTEAKLNPIVQGLF